MITLETITITITITETAIAILTQTIEIETTIVKRDPTDHITITILQQHQLQIVTIIIEVKTTIRVPSANVIRKQLN